MIKKTRTGIPRRLFLKGVVSAGLAATITNSMLAMAAADSDAVPPLQLNVRDFGATGDGDTLDTASFQRALDRCNILGGGEVLVPAGRYLIGSVTLRSHVTLRLSEGAALLGSSDLAHYSVAQVRWEGKWISGYNALLNALGARNIAVIGEGSVEGNEAVAGRPTKTNPLRRPALIEFIDCDGVLLDGFSTSYTHMWSVHPTYCTNVVIRNLTIRSTKTNGDGIDIDSCRHVQIDSCDIASGDDCISLKSGRGEEAYLLNRPTEDVRITNCTLEGRGYSCVGIGTETSAGIRDVVIEHCRVTSVFKNAIYIKSRVGRGAFIENITFRDIEASNMRAGFLRIDQVNAGTRDADPVPGINGVPLFQNFRFEDIRVHDAPVLVHATEIDADKMLNGFVLEDISGTCKEGISIANARNVLVRNVSVTGFTGPLLKIANVTGKGLQHAEEVTPPAPVAPVEAPAAPYKLH